MFKSGHHRPLTNDRGRVSHFYCFHCGENVNSRLSKVKKKSLHKSPPCIGSIHSSTPVQRFVPWNRGQGTNGGPHGLVCFWKQHPSPCSLINQAGFILNGRVLWCPSHVSFQSLSDGSHGSTFTDWEQGRCVCRGEHETNREGDGQRKETEFGLREN